MESWRNAQEGKSPLLCDEIGLSADVFGRTRKVSMGWNLIPSCNFPNMVGSSGEAIESMEFMELGLPDMMMKSDPSNPSFDNMGGEIGNNFSRTLLSPTSMITSNSSFGKSESELSLSSPVIVSNSHKSSLIDLKLGRLANWTEAENGRFPNERSVSSSSGSSSTSKRARTGNLYSQNPVCQVHGCNKDLSSSKDYHKRNRVCDVHSKTAVVTVNGIEQRFCQQCSRFHLLAEFDDGRRSCRKRLAGHNERRRKPQLFSGKSHKLLQYYEGDRFLWTSLPKRSSFVFPDRRPGCYFTSPGNLQGTQCNTITMEEGPIYSPQLPTLTMNRQSHSKPVFHLHGTGKQCSFKDFSSQTGYTFLGTKSTVQEELSGVSNSASAFSLLSAQTNPMVSPLVTPASNAHCGGDRSSEKHLGLSTGEKFSPHGFCSSGMMNSVEFDHLSPQVFFDASSSVDRFKVQLGGIFQRSDSMKSRSHLSPENGPTVDLIQLSSHLQRVEQQRNSMQVKLENDVFCSSFSTM